MRKIWDNWLKESAQHGDEKCSGNSAFLYRGTGHGILERPSFQDGGKWGIRTWSLLKKMILRN